MLKAVDRLHFVRSILYRISCMTSYSLLNWKEKKKKIVKDIADCDIFPEFIHECWSLQRIIVQSCLIIAQLEKHYSTQDICTYVKHTHVSKLHNLSKTHVSKQHNLSKTHVSKLHNLSKTHVSKLHTVTFLKHMFQSCITF